MTRAAIAAFLAIFTASLAIAQDVAGSWVFTPSNSSTLRSTERIVLKFTRDRQDALAGTAFAGHLGSLFFKITAISVSDSKVAFVLGTAGASGAKDPGAIMSFTGTVSGDDKSMTGWMQGSGFNERVTFERMGRAPTAKASPEKTPEMQTAPAASGATPGVVAAPTATADSSALLSRALAKLSGTRRQLLKYTCQETIERSYFSAPAAKKMGTGVMNEAPKQSCSGRSFGNNGHLILNAEDRLRLEVAVSEGKEIDSWASASSFDSRSIHEVVSTGPTSTGAFRTALVDIFENPGARYTLLGRRNENGRAVFTYAFEVPLAASHYRVHAGDGWRTTAYHGSFDIDPATAELTRLVSETADLPADAQACRYRTSTDYHYLPIGDGQYLIPVKSNFDVLLPNSTEDHSAIVFSGCHEYHAESSLILGLSAGIGENIQISMIQ